MCPRSRRCRWTQKRVSKIFEHIKNIYYEVERSRQNNYGACPWCAHLHRVLYDAAGTQDCAAGARTAPAHTAGTIMVSLF